MNQKQVFSEVYAVLIALGMDYIKKIPICVMKRISSNRDLNHVIKIRDDIPLENQDISNEAVAMLGALKLDYWCKSVQEKAKLNMIFNLNSKKE